jgi:hypothetical protein
MKSRRQAERSLEREIARDLKDARPMNALDAHLNYYLEGERGAAVSKLCLSVILEELHREQANGVKFDWGNRAIRPLQAEVDNAVEDPKRMRALARSNVEWEAFSTILELKCDEMELQLSQLAQFAWATAEKLISANLDEAISWTINTDGEFCRLTMSEIGRLSCVNLVQNPMVKVPSLNLRMDDPEYWRPLIRTAGGGTYFLRFAVANALVVAFASVAGVIAGEGGEESLPVLEHPALGSVLLQYTDIWTDYFKMNALMLGSLPVEQRSAYLSQQYINEGAVTATHNFAVSKLRSMSTEIGVLERDTKTLRRRLASANDAIVQAKATTRSTQESLSMARAIAAARAPAAQREKEFDAQIAEMREKDAEIRKLHDALGASDDALARMREFLNVLLEPGPEAAASSFKSHPTLPEEWRIVFVGGHERLHHKLRKQLRNSIFLHPDQSQFSPELFDNVDAVIFSIGYCSHSLVYRAANEVRKRGLRVGYSNFTNVDIVLDEIRSVLFPPASNPGLPEPEPEA